MKITKPHWLTAIAASIGAICAMLLASNTLPQYQTLISAVAGICAVVAAPTLTSVPPDPPDTPKPMPPSLPVRRETPKESA
jgi:hypothetical protein